ncbi:MAG TPA: hypothetical protein VNO55_06680 [Polyangia bacterium]|nr:hypothetical protein [Polyangia bacterium]
MLLGLWLGDRVHTKTPIADPTVPGTLQALDQRLAALQTAVALGEERCLAAINRATLLPKAETAGASLTAVQAASPKQVDPAADRLVLDRGYDLLSRAETNGVWGAEDQRAWARLMGGANATAHNELLEALIGHFKDGSLRPTRH